MPLTGCGESEPASTTARAATTTERRAKPTDCERKGIMGPGKAVLRNAEGTCRGPGRQKLTIVPFGESAQLRDLSFTVQGVRTTTRLPNGPVETAARSIFLLVRISVTNEGASIQRVRSNQFQLLTKPRYFAERTTLAANPDTLVRMTRNGLSPGKSVTGDVIFEIPRDSIDEVLRSGLVAGFSFATVTAGRPVREALVGLIPISD